MSPERPEIDAVWKEIERGWDIEPREYFEREAPRNGFKYPLCQAIHHLYKRRLKDGFLPPEAQAGSGASVAPAEPEVYSAGCTDCDALTSNGAEIRSHKPGCLIGALERAEAAEATLADLREKIEALQVQWREREKKLCRTADAQPLTMGAYAKSIADRAEVYGYCADQLDAFVSGLAPKEPA